jgi:hypothetical protein
MVKFGAVLGALALCAVAVMLWHRSRPRFEHQVAWAADGVWLKADTHVHTLFSDGGHSVDEVADRAVANGCDVLAVTDHTDSGLKAATPDYHAALEATRARLSNLVLLTGFEWNVPPGKGQDHAVVLVPPGLDGEEVWSDFKRRYDDLDKEGENPELAADAFAWMRSLSAEEKAGPPVVFLNHPSRKAPSSEAVSKQLEFLSTIGEGPFVGVEGAPGHQKATPLGAYGGALTPDDRWDPSVAPPGKAWDRQLAAGARTSGVLATSDFHSESNGDYWPCEFSATWLYAPERSAVGALRALRAGSFVGVHGGVTKGVQLSLEADGLDRPAVAGEAVRLPAGSMATIVLRAEVPATDWAGQPNRIDTVELIGVSRNGSTVLKAGSLDHQGAFRFALPIPQDGIAVRARGRRIVDDGPDLLFYTNAIRVR